MQDNPAWARGVVAPFLPVAIVVVGVLTYFLGWAALAALAVLAVLATVWSRFHDSFARPGSLPATLVGPQSMGADDDDQSPLPYEDGRCTQCSATVFRLTPGVTTRQEIVEFALGSEGWKNNPDALDGHMHPGVYCPNGCFSILIEADVSPPRVDPAGLQATLRDAFLSFANLLDMAGLCAAGGDVYRQQDELVRECRAQGRPFLRTMPMRCRTQCPLCRTDTGEAELHFEDPSQAGPTSWCGQSAGRFVDIKRSALHGVMAHGEAAPPELLDLFASVRR